MIYVVLPAYNEELAVPLLFSRIQKVAGVLSDKVAIILVDDGSSDSTTTTAAVCGEKLGLKVQVISHPQNRGLGEALKSGLLAFLASGRHGDVACTMDCDDTQPPELLITMLEVLNRRRCDIVIASRYQPGAKVVGLAAHRLFLSHGASWLFRILAPIDQVKDYTSGFRLYDYGFLERLINTWGDSLFTERGFSCMSDLLLKSRTLDPRVAEVPMVLRYDQKPTESKMKVARTIANNFMVLAKNFGAAKRTNAVSKPSRKPAQTAGSQR